MKNLSCVSFCKFSPIYLLLISSFGDIMFFSFELFLISFCFDHYLFDKFLVTVRSVWGPSGQADEKYLWNVLVSVVINQSPVGIFFCFFIFLIFFARSPFSHPWSVVSKQYLFLHFFQLFSKKGALSAEPFQPSPN